MISNPLNSRFSYAGAKLLRSYNRIFKNTKIKFNIFRLIIFGRYGSRDVIPDIIKKIIISSRKLKKKDCKIKIKAQETRQYFYIEDAIDQLEVIKRFSKKAEIYNVGQSKEIKIKKLISLIGKYLKIKAW